MSYNTWYAMFAVLIYIYIWFIKYNLGYKICWYFSFQSPHSRRLFHETLCKDVRVILESITIICAALYDFFFDILHLAVALYGVVGYKPWRI